MQLLGHPFDTFNRKIIIYLCMPIKFNKILFFGQGVQLSPKFSFQWGMLFSSHISFIQCSLVMCKCQNKSNGTNRPGETKSINGYGFNYLCFTAFSTTLLHCFCLHCLRMVVKYVYTSPPSTDI